MPGHRQELGHRRLRRVRAGAREGLAQAGRRRPIGGRATAGQEERQRTQGEGNRPDAARRDGANGADARDPQEHRHRHGIGTTALLLKPIVRFELETNIRPSIGIRMIRGGTCIGRMKWRKSREASTEPLDDRAWSARTSVRGRVTTTEMVRYTALPAETGPTWAPDELSVWPVEGGRYGVDAHYHGATGARRAEHQQRRLAEVNLAAGIRPHPSGGATLRLGPLQHQAAWLALEAFIGRPIDTPMAG
jgi:hypothetical protein